MKNTPTPTPRPTGYLAKNRQLNWVTAAVGLVWGWLEYLSGSTFWLICALLLVVFSLMNLVATRPSSPNQ
ncbi:MAG: hypothetical protein ACPGQS_04590 [Bradymonadia bacterium]